MSASILQWGEAIGIQWHDKGPITFISPDGMSWERFTTPTDAIVLVSVHEPVTDETYDDAAYDLGHTEGYDTGYADAIGSVIHAIENL